MPLDGITYGGADRIRGGDGHDSIHAGAGDDLVNGDTGGDSVFGDRGNDVLWGGPGVPAHRPTRRAWPTRAPRVSASTTWPAGRTRTSSTGARAASTERVRPSPAGRAAPAPSRVTTKKDGTTDPCSWFEMTERADDVATSTSRRRSPTTSTTRASTGSTAAGTATSCRATCPRTAPHRVTG